jgi:hypothetical protein
MENSESTSGAATEGTEETATEVPGATVRKAGDDQKESDVEGPGTPGTLQDLAADAMTQKKH